MNKGAYELCQTLICSLFGAQAPPPQLLQEIGNNSIGAPLSSFSTNDVSIAQQTDSDKSINNGRHLVGWIECYDDLGEDDLIQELTRIEKTEEGDPVFGLSITCISDTPNL